MQLGRDRRTVRGPEPVPAPRHRYASSDDPHERIQEYRRAFERMRETVEFLLFEYYIEQEPTPSYVASAPACCPTNARGALPCQDSRRRRPDPSSSVRAA
ncbi:hypothetical protein PBRA_002183 [Plasmodiophora brassicae]|uniref:Uncharacterized protein n=1 Tax=Plasmodiophora brassicae TaxID=37360 RepID=A0A0G4J215_PLABS|nr:hypothetical protein PBRA_002183 [Plasmodiophora brassicae]